MEWSNVFDDSRNEKLEKEVLDALKPHSDNLKDLVIQSYGGKLFPNWIRDPLFLLLTYVRIYKCGNCMFLPSLGELPSLKKLVIEELNDVKVVGSEFIRTSAVMFTCLKELYIKDCPNLAEVSLEALPSLKVLDLRGCGVCVFTSLIYVASPVIELSIGGISGLSDEVWRGVMNYLGSVKALSIWMCNEIRYLRESKAEASKVLMNLTNLIVGGCSKLVSLGEKEEAVGCNQLTSLRMLYLNECHSLERCKFPNSIQELNLELCDLIASISFPTEEGHKLKSLKISLCELLPEKEMLLDTSMPLMLKFMRIKRWKNLQSINELTCFIYITYLTILDCSRIESFPAADLPKLKSLIDLTILNCKSMDIDSFGVWPPKLRTLMIGNLKNLISKLGPQNFPPSLVELFLYGGSREEEDVTCGSQLSHMLPSSLTKLWLKNFEQLEIVSKGLQHLTSLQHLRI
ncbi:NB-ARC domains-containing protein [Tanacetum coccineum]